MKFLVTGGAGFIGSAFVRMAISSSHTVVNLDKLTYAGNLENLTAVSSNERYRFVHGDICDGPLVTALLEETQPEVIVNFAAESHVDRSILSPAPVFETNLRGTFTLLEAARLYAKRVRFLHVSTDEVYGSIDAPYDAHERYPLRASSPYSASKAGSDLLNDDPNLDFGLVALSRAYGLPKEAPLLLFALGRTVGWIAHAIEQYASSELIRPRARYTGVAPA